VRALPFLRHTVFGCGLELGPAIATVGFFTALIGAPNRTSTAITPAPAPGNFELAIPEEGRLLDGALRQLSGGEGVTEGGVGDFGAALLQLGGREGVTEGGPTIFGFGAARSTTGRPVAREDGRRCVQSDEGESDAGERELHGGGGRWRRRRNEIMKKPIVIKNMKTRRATVAIYLFFNQFY